MEKKNPVNEQKPSKIASRRRNALTALLQLVGEAEVRRNRRRLWLRRAMAETGVRGSVAIDRSKVVVDDLAAGVGGRGMEHTRPTAAAYNRTVRGGGRLMTQTGRWMTAMEACRTNFTRFLTAIFWRLWRNACVFSPFRASLKEVAKASEPPGSW